MLATLEHPPHLIKVSAKFGKHEVRAHIARMIATILNSRPPIIGDGNGHVEPMAPYIVNKGCLRNRQLLGFCLLRLG
jgi:hypothetical protein